MKTSRVLAWFGFGGALLAPALAFAADPPPAEPPAVPPPPSGAAPAATPAPAAAPSAATAPASPPPASPLLGKIDLSMPPAAPSTPRTYHMHDGFYLRGAVSIGSLGATLDDNSSYSLKGSGASLGFDLMVGGSPSVGVAVGGALILEGTASVSFDRGSTHAVDRSLSLAIIGPFIDGFPTPSRGWHFGGTVGLARLSVGSVSADQLNHTNGLGGAFWLGNDLWVADDWSVGPLLKFTGALTRASSPDVSASSFSISIGFTGLFH